MVTQIPLVFTYHDSYQVFWPSTSSVLMQPPIALINIWEYGLSVMKNDRCGFIRYLIKVSETKLP